MEVLDADGLALQAALKEVGSALTVPGQDIPTQEPVVEAGQEQEPVLSDVVVDAPEPGNEKEPAQAHPTVAEQIAAALAQEREGRVTRDDLAALHQSQQATQQQIAEALRLLAEQRQAPAPQQPQLQVPREITLLEAQDAYYLNGDRSLMVAYEAQQQAKQEQVRQQEQARLAAEQEAQHQQTERHKLVVAIANEYPFIGQMSGWKEMLSEYERLQASPVHQATFPADSRYTVEMGGQQIDLRVAAQAASVVHAKREALAAKQAQQEQQATEQQQQQRQTQAPGVQGGNQQQRQTPQQPTHIIPSDLVQGPDALLARPDVARALERAGWGKDMRTQAKHLAEKTRPATREAWAQQWKSGQGTVRSA